MTRRLSCFAALVLLLTGFGRAQNKPAIDKPAIDKAALEAYIRHLYVMDQRVTVKVSDPKPSELPGFLDVTVSASMGNTAQDFPLLVSKDGARIIQGTVYNSTENPFKKDLDKLKTDGAPNIGTKGASVVVVEFSDFECPYCQKEAKILHDNLLSAYPTQVHLYFKQFPLASIHPWSRAAAIASRCVFRQNGEEFWKYHDWIFQHQNDINKENLKDQVLGWAKEEKDLDSLQLASCMDTRATEAEVDKEIAEGRALNVDSTPTLFINGRRLASASEWPTLRAVIDYEIEYQKTAKNAGEDCGCTLKLDLPGVPQPTASRLSPVGSAKRK